MHPNEPCSKPDGVALAEVLLADLSESDIPPAAEDATPEQQLERIVCAWREAHEPLVRSVEHLALEEVPLQATTLARRFGPESVLLALATDPLEHADELVPLFLAGLKGPTGRQARRLWRRLRGSEEEVARSPPTRRVVVVGSQVRDSLVAELQRPDTQVDWRECVKGKGRGSEQRALKNLSGADGLIVVVGSVNHTIMEGARRACDQLGIPCQFVARGTRRQLEEAIQALLTRQGNGADPSDTP